MAEKTDQEILNEFGPLYNRFGNQTTTPALLAHYTSIRAVERILQSNEIWLSNPLFMNDHQEMRFGINEGGRLFSTEKILKRAGVTADRMEYLRQCFVHFYQAFDSNEAFDTYVFCLSRHEPGNTDGLLSMWRGYGKHGSGAALIFDPNAIEPVVTSPLIVSEVRYASDADRSAELERMLEEWADITAQADIPTGKLFLAAHAAFAAVKAYALTSKHKGFSEELEWRVIYVPDRDQQKVLKPFLKYDIGERGVEPKLKFPMRHIEGVSAADLSFEKLLRGIILGPSASSPLAKRSVERMLETIGKPHFKDLVQSSGIPLRPVSGTSF